MKTTSSTRERLIVDPEQERPAYDCEVTLVNRGKVEGPEDNHTFAIKNHYWFSRVTAKLVSWLVPPPAFV